ncbi:cell division protein FtsQ/DivIB [Paludibacterium denitrificans]|uniref:cell division protein FtsQ/DivIB n=1 Tax=Paludibacterium denitrificans TaxID=2675226 RepID=UPI001E614354|nr:FtsQ-type POTRA domain-containing protein [Paludibacterium denitrificans]
MLGAAVLMLVYAGGFWLTHAPVFPVKKIRISGQMTRVTPEQLKFIAEHELSGTFFTLDIDKTRAAFGKLPWVRDARYGGAGRIRWILRLKSMWHWRAGAKMAWWIPKACVLMRPAIRTCRCSTARPVRRKT